MSMDIDAPVVLPSRPLIPQAGATYYILALPPKEPLTDSLQEFFAVTVVHP